MKRIQSKKHKSNDLISAKKRLKVVGNKSFQIINFISWSNSLISTFR